MSYRAVVIEDDELINRLISLNLKSNGYQVSSHLSAEDFLETGEQPPFDIMILDLRLPGMNGLELIKHIREKGLNAPILMLTVEQHLPTKIEAFDSGADDYLSKPFDMEELIARVKRIIIRSTGERVIPSDQIVIINRYKINLSTRTCESSQGQVILSEKEVRLLSYFSLHAGRTLSREDILEEVWGMDVDPTPRTIDNFVAKFRKLFEDSPESPRHFITVRNRGYRFKN